MLNAIQIKIETLSQDLKESLAKVTKVLESRPPSVQTGYLSGPAFASTGLPTGLGASVSTKPIDRSRNVIIFGVHESRSLLEIENLVRQTFEFAVGRKIELVDCRHLGQTRRRVDL